jgi:glycogen(starch) synthase
MATKLKILIITNLYPPQVLGGYERSIADFARLLQHQGHRVLVLTSDTPAFFANHTSLYPDPEVQRCLQLGGKWDPKQGDIWLPAEELAAIMVHNMEVLSSYLQALQPDVCLAGNMDFLPVDLLQQILGLGIPVCHYVMNAQPGHPANLAPKNPLYRYATCSSWVGRELQQAGYPAENAQTVYPGAAVDEFFQQMLPPKDELRIAYASIVAPYKGADVLAEALAVLHAMNIPFTATFAGNAPAADFLEALQTYIESEGFLDQVNFVGILSRQQLIELYKTHNVLVFPSRFEEPFGISQVEAMAAGLALVTSGTGGAKEIVEHGQDGLIFESENPLDLADLLSGLSADPIRWEAIARKGQQTALSRFSQTQAAKQLEALLQELTALKESALVEQSATKTHAIGRYSLALPLNHQLDAYQKTWKRYDTALGYIAQIVFQKYPHAAAIDIGANVGDSAGLIRNYAEVPILCVEGNPEFVSYLEQNAEQIGGVAIAPWFVGKDGDTVAAEQIRSQAGTAMIINAVATEGDRLIQVKSLKTLLEEYPTFENFKLLKLDTDGFDFSIIQDSAEIIAENLPILYFEYDIHSGENSKVESLETLKLLSKIGYEYFAVYDNFGNYLISLSSQDHERFIDLNAYLESNYTKSGTIVVYYFDICAFPKCDIDLFEQNRQFEISTPASL